MVAIDAASQGSALELAGMLGVGILTPKSVAEGAPREIVVFVGLRRSAWAAVWQLVWLGRVYVPIVFIIGESRWPTGESTCEETVFFDGPTADQLHNAFDRRSAVFLHAHGRADALLLQGGRICIGPTLADANQIATAPACGALGRCYRADQKTVRVNGHAPRLLFTNACEFITIGPDSPMDDRWSVFSALRAAGVVTAVGAPGYRHGIVEEISIAAGLFRVGFPVWRIVHTLNRELHRTGIQYPSLVLYGDPFLCATYPGAANELKALEGVASFRSQIGNVPTVIRSFHGFVEAPERLTASLQADEDLWVFGPGEVVFHDASSLDISKRLADESQYAADLERSLRVCDPERTEAAKRQQLQLALNRANALIARAAISPNAVYKLLRLVDGAGELRAEIQHALVGRLANNASSATSQLCLCDLVDRRLPKVTVHAGLSCSECERSTLEIDYSEGWKGILCTRCGLRAVRSGEQSIADIDAPRVARAGTRWTVAVSTTAEEWMPSVLRGNQDGLACRRLDAHHFELSIDRATPPHFYFLRLYAARKGVLEAVSRSIRVLPQ